MARRHRITLSAIVATLLCLGGTPGRAEQSDQQQMRGLDEQVQEIKSDVLGISQELSRLEEKLLYPSGTEVAVFVALAKGEQMRLDAVRVQIEIWERLLVYGIAFGLADKILDEAKLRLPQEALAASPMGPTFWVIPWGGDDFAGGLSSSFAPPPSPSSSSGGGGFSGGGGGSFGGGGGGAW